MDSWELLISEWNSITNRKQKVECLKKIGVVVAAEYQRSPLLSAPYSRLCRALLSRLTASFYGLLTRTEAEELYVRLFLDGPLVDSFLTLNTALQSPDSSAFAIETIVLLLERFISERLHVLFSHFVSCTGSWTQAPSLVQLIVSLPTRIGNVSGIHGASISTAVYVRRVCVALCRSLQAAHDRLSDAKDADLRFDSCLIAKLCTAGYGSDCCQLLVPWLSARMHKDTTDGIWHRIAERLFVGDGAGASLESLVTEAVLAAKVDSVANLFGGAIHTSDRFKFLFTHKLLLVRTFRPDARVPEKICSYLCAAQNRRPFLCQVLLNLLEVWADPGALIHSSTEERQYLCRSVLVFASALTEGERTQLQSEVMTLVLNGMGHGLSCLNSTVRNQMMLVTRELSKLFQPETEPPEFEPDATDPLIAELLEVVNGKNEEASDIADSLTELLDLGQPETQEKIFDAKAYDSDDEFEPYLIPAAELDNKSSEDDRPPPPAYIRDTFDGLLEEQNFAKFESCFFAIESQVRRNAVGFGDICVELVLRVLHLENRFSTPDFAETRHKILVACGVARPKQVAACLIEQFYAREYTISQRLVALDAIRGVAEQLSDVSSSEPSPPLPNVAPSETLPVWRQIVEKRIASKTRKITEIPKTPSEKPVINRLAPVAPDLFFGLLPSPGQRRQPFLDLMDRDYLVLARLVHCLSVVLHCAQHCPSILSMCQSLLNHVWALRFHQQSFVRQSVVFAVTMVVLSLSPRLLVTQLPMADLSSWLQIVCEKDTDEECKRMAEKCIWIVQNRMQTAYRDVMTVQ